MEVACQEADMSLHAATDDHDAPARVVGLAAVFLRPLRYMLDVETDVAVVDEEDSTEPSLPFDSMHVHLRVATRAPLMERNQLLSGFLRAETPIYSSEVSRPGYGCSSEGIASKYTVEMQDSKEEQAEDDCDGGDRTLRSLRGTFVWLLVRLQPLRRGTNMSTSLVTTDAEGGKRALRVQYQVSPASESYCLPVDHTNVSVVKLLVTDELLLQVDSKMLQFTILSAPLAPVEVVAVQPATPAITSTIYYDAALAASEASVAEEVRRRQRVEADLVEAHAAAQAKDRERLEAQQQAKQDAQRAQELELVRSEQVHARALLQQELARHEQQNQELSQTRTSLENQLRAANESAQRFQINVTTTDQAVEVHSLSRVYYCRFPIQSLTTCLLVSSSPVAEATGNKRRQGA
ncbi:hypothetical protein BBJ28_00010288 [Nothophytophthora sp. Chile5]|nr:hypothetical protein BBJ28_00010288 [Nothophytophthora sp. Chile5]